MTCKKKKPSEFTEAVGTCRHCGSELLQKRGESRGHFSTRKFCDLDCYQANVDVPCSYPGCGGRKLARGLCSKHYARVRANGSPEVVRRIVGASLAERLAAYSRPDGDCLVWFGGTHRSGHGKIQVSGRSIGTHRIAFIEAYGPIPEGLVVRHKCDNPPCIRPEHLELGTSADNTNDRTIRGRTSTARRKLDATQVVEVRRRILAGDFKRDIAMDFGVVPTVISNIALGRAYVGVGVTV